MEKTKIDYKKLNANKRFCNDDVIQDIAEQFNVTPQFVSDIADAQSKFLAKTIKSGGMQTIIIPYLGKFKVNPYHVQKLMGKSMKK